MTAHDLTEIAAALNMRARDDTEHPGEVYVSCRSCGWGDAAPVVAEKYAVEPFGCHRCKWRGRRRRD